MSTNLIRLADAITASHRAAPDAHCCALGVDDRHLFTDAPAARPVARTA